MNKILPAIALLIILGCHSQKTSTASKKGQGDTRTKPVQNLTSNAYLIVEKANDSSYAYTRLNPVHVGGVKDNTGPIDEKKYLNGLLGPHGEELTYYRAGSCCPFKTPNGFIDNTGMLDRYIVTWDEGDTLSIYINMYDKGDLKIPVGLTAKKKD